MAPVDPRQALSVLPGSLLGFLNQQDPVNLHVVQYLLDAARPSDFNLPDLLILSQAKVHP